MQPKPKLRTEYKLIKATYRLPWIMSQNALVPASLNHRQGPLRFDQIKKIFLTVTLEIMPKFNIANKKKFAYRGTLNKSLDSINELMEL